MFQADDAENKALTLSACARECVEAVPGTAVCVAERAAADVSKTVSKTVFENRTHADEPATSSCYASRWTLPPEWTPPSGRLETLVEQALAAQTRRCEYHNANCSATACGEEQLPTRAALTLDAHNDEVWSLAFDHTGTRLATASRDGTVILWEVLARARARAHTRQPGSTSARTCAWTASAGRRGT